MTDAKSNPRSHPIDPASLAALPRTSGVYIFRGEGAFRLRRSRTLCTIRLSQEAGAIMPLVVSGRDVCIGQVDGLFGLFSSLHAAHSKLRELADQHRLCLGLLGLEKNQQARLLWSASQNLLGCLHWKRRPTCARPTPVHCIEGHAGPCLALYRSDRSG